MNFRTDRNNNPTAFTTDIAKEAGLVLNRDYTFGDSFISGVQTYYTAKLLHDPIDLTIKVIDSLGFYTDPPHARWIYISMPYKLWMNLSKIQKSYVVGFMYSMEGGEELKYLFPEKLD